LEENCATIEIKLNEDELESFNKLAEPAEIHSERNDILKFGANLYRYTANMQRELFADIRLPK